MKLTTYFHLVPRLRMSGAIRVLPPYAFMAWTGTTLLFLLLHSTSCENLVCSLLFAELVAERIRMQGSVSA
jgi:hypothetical protein